MPTTPRYSLPSPLLTDANDVPADMLRLATATEDALAGIEQKATDIAPTEWQAVATIGSWSHYGGAQCQYRVIGGDTLELRGMLSSGPLGTAAANMATGKTITNRTRIVPALCSSNVIQRIEFRAHGTTPGVMQLYIPSESTAARGWLSLDGITIAL